MSISCRYHTETYKKMSRGRHIVCFVFYINITITEVAYFFNVYERESFQDLTLGLLDTSVASDSQTYTLSMVSFPIVENWKVRGYGVFQWGSVDNVFY
jgi:hypothetical protein